MARIRIENVSKSYDGVSILKDFSLEVAEGEFVVLVGPSGCGKSTMLKILAGLEDVSAGRILIGERDVTDVAPGERDVAMVFQNYALYPHLTVQGNMGFGLKMRGVDRAEIARRVEAAARILGIESLLERRPRQLSGGQRQRVALGRAIVREPQAFLMDEPLSNLDAKLRVNTRAEISALHQRLRTTTIYVTHDQTEAMTMADRIVLMKGGVIQQIADPDTMFRRPANLFVAGFLGSPGMNFFRVPMNMDGGQARITLFGNDIPLPPGIGGPPRGVIAGLRPEYFSVEKGRYSLEAAPKLVESLGSEHYLHFEMPGEYRLPSQEGAGERERDENTFIARVPAVADGGVGQPMRLFFDDRSLALFDAETQLALT